MIALLIISAVVLPLLLTVALCRASSHHPVVDSSPLPRGGGITGRGIDAYPVIGRSPSST